MRNLQSGAGLFLDFYNIPIVILMSPLANNFKPTMKLNVTFLYNIIHRNFKICAVKKEVYQQKP